MAVGINSHSTWNVDLFGNPISSTEDASLAGGLNNLFTGNLDYQRELEMLQNNQMFNASEAKKQRDFEERLSNTSYQRAFEDMKKAGLNPALLYNSSGASTPSGSSASSSGGHSGKAGSGFLNLLTGLITLTGFALKNNSELARMNIDKSVAEANIERFKALTEMNGSNSAYLKELGALTNINYLNARDARLARMKDKEDINYYASPEYKRKQEAWRKSPEGKRMSRIGKHLFD